MVSNPHSSVSLSAGFPVLCVKHVGQDVQLPAHWRHLLAVRRGVHQWVHQHSRVLSLSLTNIVCASHSLLYCKASSVSNEEVTFEFQAVTTSQSQKVKLYENKLLPSERTLTSNPAKHSHLISVKLELRVFKQSEVVETGRSLRSWSWPDSAVNDKV